MTESKPQSDYEKFLAIVLGNGWEGDARVPLAESDVQTTIQLVEAALSARRVVFTTVETGPRGHFECAEALRRFALNPVEAELAPMTLEGWRALQIRHDAVSAVIKGEDIAGQAAGLWIPSGLRERFRPGAVVLQLYMVP